VRVTDDIVAKAWTGAFGRMQQNKFWSNSELHT
jgi:hypothetical protein